MRMFAAVRATALSVRGLQVTQSVGFEYLSWEPCITKHKAHYDDPWVEDQDDSDHPNKKKV